MSPGARWTRQAGANGAELGALRTPTGAAVGVSKTGDFEIWKMIVMVSIANWPSFQRTAFL